jgi:hypothetical protein
MNRNLEETRASPRITMQDAQPFHEKHENMVKPN